MSAPIERIQDYACEVNEEQWWELVKAADEVGFPICDVSREMGMMKPDKFARYNDLIEALGVYPDKYGYQEEIPYPDFLAKLKGDEKWEPKNGEEVEVSVGRPSKWVKAEFVCMHKGYFICNIKHEWEYLPFSEKQIRTPVETITRAEAEQILGKRIVD